MLSAIRRRIHLSPATVIAGLALVFAMSGGAYAAKKYLITSTKQISPSVLKQLQGKAGAAGAPGAQGTPGAQGAQGPAGPAGTAGAGGGKGETGPAGAKGTTGATGAKGATGATGTTGFTEKLPKGATETGTWSIFETRTEAYGPFTAISFPIPLASSGKAYAFNKAETEEIENGKPVGISGCSGSVTKPTAPPGTLCVYTHQEVTTGGLFGTFLEAIPPSEPLKAGYDSSGALIKQDFLNGEENAPASIESWGVWAVTAP